MSEHGDAGYQLDPMASHGESDIPPALDGGAPEDPLSQLGAAAAGDPRDGMPSPMPTSMPSPDGEWAGTGPTAPPSEWLAEQGMTTPDPMPTPGMPMPSPDVTMPSADDQALLAAEGGLISAMQSDDMLLERLAQEGVGAGGAAGSGPAGEAGGAPPAPAPSAPSAAALSAEQSAQSQSFQDEQEANANAQAASENAASAFDDYINE